MRNILSCIAGTKFTGKEILDLAQYQVENKTSHERQGRLILKRFGNIKPEKMYTVSTNYSGAGCGEVVRKPRVCNVIEVE